MSEVIKEMKEREERMSYKAEVKLLKVETGYYDTGRHLFQFRRVCGNAGVEGENQIEQNISLELIGEHAGIPADLFHPDTWYTITITPVLQQQSSDTQLRELY